MAGTYRDDRRKSGGRIASSLKDAGRKAARAFFGASPSQKKKLRKTVDKRGVKLNQLDLDGLDRSKFNAPEKVGESVKLIDIAMGNAPAGPAPGLAPPPPPPIPERPTRRPRARADEVGASRPRTTSGRLAPPSPTDAVEEREEDEEDDQEESSGAGVVTGLSSLLALACLVFVLAGGPLMRTYKPDLAVAAALARDAEVDPWGNAWCASVAVPPKRWSAGPNGSNEGLMGDDVRDLGADLDPALLKITAWSYEGALALGLFFTWIAMSLGRLRNPRGGFVTELVRTSFFASVPALGGAGLLLWSVGALPSLPVTPPPELAPRGAAILEHVAPLAAATGLAATHAAAAAWGVLCLVVAWVVRRVLSRAETAEG
jgi:hypothetical protein